MGRRRYHDWLPRFNVLPLDMPLVLRWEARAPQLA